MIQLKYPLYFLLSCFVVESKAMHDLQVQLLMRELQKFVVHIPEVCEYICVLDPCQKTLVAFKKTQKQIALSPAFMDLDTLAEQKYRIAYQCALALGASDADVFVSSRLTEEERTRIAVISSHVNRLKGKD